MNNESVDVTIIGAGLTGLTLGYYLTKAGHEVRMIEKADRAGGVMDTVNDNGFTFETGPNSGIISTPELVELLDDLKDKVEVEVADPNAKYRWIWKAGEWHALPSGLLSAISTPLFTLKDKFRVLGEPFRSPGKNPNETVSELVRRRLGKSFLDYAIDPFISGIYAGNPELLVTKYALPKLYNLEQNYGSFIRGAMKKRREPKSELEKRATKEVFSVKGGFVRLIRALEEAIGKEQFHFGSKELKIRPHKNEFEIEFMTTSGQFKKLTSGKVVTTMPGDALTNVLPFIPNQLLSPIADLKYARVVQVIACYKNWKGKELKAFGGLIPSLENRNALGILFPSSLFKGRAPDGGAVLSIFMGGIKKPGVFEKTDEELKELALKEISETLGHSNPPDLLQIHRYRHAIPQYEITSGERFAAIDEIQSQYPGLILAGNIRDGIGIPDRVKQGRQLAEALKS